MVNFEDNFQYDGGSYIKANVKDGLSDVYPIKKSGLWLFGGVDPQDNSWKIAYILYPKFQISNSPGYTLASAQQALSKIDINSANTSCKICQKANKVLGNDNLINEQMPIVDMEIQTPVQYSQKITSRDIVPISALSNLAKLGQQIACKPAGKLLTSGFLATFFDYISGSTSDPGLKGTLDELAGKFLENADICDSDRVQLQKDLVSAYGTYRASGSLAAALTSLMFRNVGEMLAGKGLQATVTKKENKVTQTTYALGPSNGNRMIG